MTQKAPERIWAWPYNGETHRGGWSINGDLTGEAEYIRKDVADAAVAAEREACAGEAVMVADSNVSRAYDLSDPSVPFAKAEAARLIAEAIRARGNTDALAERDTRIRAEALREAAAFVDVSFGWAEGIADEILALIPDTDEGDG